MQGNCCNWTACLGRIILGLFIILMAALNFMHPEANLVVLTAHHVPSPDNYPCHSRVDVVNRKGCAHSGVDFDRINHRFIRYLC
jgi:hypothetical protein